MSWQITAGSVEWSSAVLGVCCSIFTSAFLQDRRSRVPLTSRKAAFHADAMSAREMKML
jgi:hypothetical protein